MNGDLPLLNILFRGGFFQLAAELVPHRRCHPVGKTCITARPQMFIKRGFGVEFAARQLPAASILSRRHRDTLA
jgi:hypothetical protein